MLRRSNGLRYLRGAIDFVRLDREPATTLGGRYVGQIANQPDTQ